MEEKSGKRLIAFIDILGFKKLCEKKSANEIKSILALFTDTAEWTEKINRDFGIIAFSDTVIIYQIEMGMDSTRWSDLIFFVRNIFITMLRHGYPLRCVINFGEFYVDRSNESTRELFWGKALIDAYEAEKTENIVGIFILPQAVCIGEEKPIKNLELAYPDEFHVKFDDRVFVNLFVRLCRIPEYYSIKNAAEDFDPEVQAEINAYFKLKGMMGEQSPGKDKEKYTNSLKLAELFLTKKGTIEGTRLEEIERFHVFKAEYDL